MIYSAFLNSTFTEVSQQKNQGLTTKFATKNCHDHQNWGLHGKNESATSIDFKMIYIYIFNIVGVYIDGIFIQLYLMLIYI
jgi:hypothetical protein